MTKPLPRPLSLAKVGDRRFPPPWTVDEGDECFSVHDRYGQTLGYFYFEENEGRRSIMKRLTREEARKMAANFAKLPALLQAEAYRKAKGE